MELDLRYYLIAIYLYTLLFCCLFVSKKMSKQLNRSGPNFVWDLTFPRERFMDAQNFLKLLLKFLIFEKILKIHENINVNPPNFYNCFNEEKMPKD